MKFIFLVLSLAIILAINSVLYSNPFDFFINYLKQKEPEIKTEVVEKEVIVKETEDRKAIEESIRKELEEQNLNTLNTNNDEVEKNEDISESKKEEIKYLNSYNLKFENFNGKRVTKTIIDNYIKNQVNLLFAYQKSDDSDEIIDIETIDDVPEAKSYILTLDKSINTYIIKLSDKDPKIDYEKIPDELFDFAKSDKNLTSLDNIVRLIKTYPNYTYKYQNSNNKINTSRKIKEQIISYMITANDRADKIPWSLVGRSDGFHINYHQFATNFIDYFE